jgi:uncharacterized protein YbcC (UPF0753/DUF2309 family)
MEVNAFNLKDTLHKLEHYLPSQAPLKDFIHHNTLHAFQGDNFDEALAKAQQILGYKVFLSLVDYRDLFQQGKINMEIIEKIIAQEKGVNQVDFWKEQMLNGNPDCQISKRIGKLRYTWREAYKIDLEQEVKPILFKILSSYLDQGISVWKFPGSSMGLLETIKTIELDSFTSFFKRKRSKEFLFDNSCTIESLLALVVGDESLYEQYLFDQQFSHPGWSGMVSVVEKNPQTLLDTKRITLEELIKLELLLEIDNLDNHFGETWAPINLKAKKSTPLFNPIEEIEYTSLQLLWQKAFEASYYNSVLNGLRLQKKTVNADKEHSFQAIFCIDDRECSIRRHIESIDTESITYGTPGHFGLDIYFQPMDGKFITKVCPAPLSPRYLIKEESENGHHVKEYSVTKRTHGLLGGWLIAQTLGFWSAIKLFIQIFRPSISPFTSLSFNHMHADAKLSIENTDKEGLYVREHGLQVGFTIEEMAGKIDGVLKSIDLIDNFSPLVYAIGHGSSSVNNTYYAGYDCGACSGRPGSVNARVFADMANRKGVREILAKRGIVIPETTQFVGGLHDTSRDEIAFFDEQVLSEENKKRHHKNSKSMHTALSLNAKERSRRFDSIQSDKNAKQVHKKVKGRSISLFEPRPELNHATNTLCIIGQRYLTESLFLDRRAFLNSYNYAHDLEGVYLEGILNAVAPVCGGINLEYYFSRVDNEKLGAGSKLPHNVMGLIGVANGIDGDLQTGLPYQMVEVHDPLRLMVVVEHYPEVVLATIQRNASTYEWFQNKWVYLTVIHPETRKFYQFDKGSFPELELVHEDIKTIKNMDMVFSTAIENLPVSLFEKHLS